MTFDLKKEYQEFYLPKDKPALIEVPTINYLAVRGQGDPTQADGDYQQALNQLYGVAYAANPAIANTFIVTDIQVAAMGSSSAFCGRLSKAAFFLR